MVDNVESNIFSVFWLFSYRICTIHIIFLKLIQCDRGNAAMVIKFNCTKGSMSTICFRSQKRWPRVKIQRISKQVKQPTTRNDSASKHRNWFRCADFIGFWMFLFLAILSYKIGVQGYTRMAEWISRPIISGFYSKYSWIPLILMAIEGECGSK